jgi:hypothetical protein
MSGFAWTSRSCNSVIWQNRVPNWLLLLSGKIEHRRARRQTTANHDRAENDEALRAKRHQYHSADLSLSGFVLVLLLWIQKPSDNPTKPQPIVGMPNV